MSKLMFVAFRPKSSADYTASLLSEETTFHHDHRTGFGEGFNTEEEALEDYWSQNEPEAEEVDPTDSEIDQELWSCDGKTLWDSAEEAIEEYKKAHAPELLPIGSELDGLYESLDSNTVALDAEDFAKLCLEEAADALGEGLVIFEHCPRGFANEMAFIAVGADEADEYRDCEGYTEITREQFISECERGGENHAENDSANDPACGSYGLTIAGQNAEC
jgi:hypothetical protein